MQSPACHRRWRRFLVALLLGGAAVVAWWVIEGRRIGDATCGGECAPEIEAEDIRGGRVSLRALRGRVVMIVFVARWALPAEYERRALVRLSEEYRAQPVSLLLIELGRAWPPPMLLTMPADTPCALVHDPEGLILRRYEDDSRALPQTVWIGRRGAIIRRMTGYRSSDEPLWASVLDAALAQEPVQPGAR